MKAKSTTFYRKTISIPTKLMDSMRKHKEVNWSAVAAKAFTEVLVDIDNDWESDDLSATKQDIIDLRQDMIEQIAKIIRT